MREDKLVADDAFAGDVSLGLRWRLSVLIVSRRAMNRDSVLHGKLADEAVAMARSGSGVTETTDRSERAEHKGRERRRESDARPRACPRRATLGSDDLLGEPVGEFVPRLGTRCVQLALEIGVIGA